MLRVLTVLLFLISFSFSQEIPQKLINKLERKQQTNKFENTQIPNSYESNFFPKKQEIETKEEIPEKTEAEKAFEKEALSNIEKIYNERIGKEIKEEKLKQFGHDFFKNYKVYEMGPVGDDYVLGPGDIVLLYLWGDPVDILNLKGVYSLYIDREGKIYIPNLGVFYIWGLTVSKAKKLLYDFFSKKFKNFEIEISLGKLRTFPVYVSGFVNKPSVVMATGINTVLDVLSMAGGISKNGSLRKIKIVRKTGEEKTIDLYDLLIKGKPINVRVKEGDSIYVYPIGKTVAISGRVKRPAIYELEEKEDNIKTLINLAGGLLASAYSYNVKLYRYENNMLILKEGALNDRYFLDTKLKDGDYIKIERILNIVQNSIKIEGYVTYPGEYPIEKTPTLKDAILKAVPFVDTNLYYGEIIRTEEGKPPIYMTFTPEDVLNGKSNIELKPLDVIRFYKFGDIKSVDFNKFRDSIVLKGAIKYPGVYAYKPNMKLSDVFDDKQLLIDTNLYYAEIIRKEYKNGIYEEKVINFLPKDIIEHEKDMILKPMDIVYFYPERIYAPIKISGEIKEPQIVPYYKGITLLDVLKDVNFNINPTCEL